MKVIGLTGTNASGKTEVAAYLRRKGYRYYSLSDILREEATRMGLDHSRKTLIELGNTLRKMHGAGVLAKMAKENLKGRSIIIDSIRNPKEVEELRMLHGFLLIGIDAPVDLRFKRAIKRGRAGDAKTLKDFIRDEKLENSRNKASQQLEKCLKLADVLIINDGTKRELHRNIEAGIFTLKRHVLCERAWCPEPKAKDERAQKVSAVCHAGANKRPMRGKYA